MHCCRTGVRFPASPLQGEVLNSRFRAKVRTSPALCPLIWRGVRPCDKSAITRRRRTSSRSRSRFLGSVPGNPPLCRRPGPGTRRQDRRWRVISWHITEGLGPIERAIRTWGKPVSNPTIIAARSSHLASDDSSQPAPPAALLPHKLLTPYDTADRRRGRMVLMHLMALGAF